MYIPIFARYHAFHIFGKRYDHYYDTIAMCDMNMKSPMLPVYSQPFTDQGAHACP